MVASVLWKTGRVSSRLLAVRKICSTDPGHGNDTISDFTDGEDTIDITAISDICGFGDLTVTADGSAAVIDLTAHGGGTIPAR